MEHKTTNSSSNPVHAFDSEFKFSAFQPIDVKPVIGRKWVTNGIDNVNFKRYKDAYDDSPTNSSIIDAFVSYIFGEGLIDRSKIDDNETDPAKIKANLEKAYLSIKPYIAQADVLLACQDYKLDGGCSFQNVWSEANKPLRVEYIPVYKLAINVDCNMKVDGFWYSWDWCQRFKYRPTFIKKFMGKYVEEQNLDILYIRKPTAEPFFPVPDYFSGLPWAKVEGELANGALHHFQNGMEDITVVNYNNGRIEDDAVAKAEAKKVREKVVGTNNKGKVLVSFNEGAEEALVIDRISPPELNQQNVFFSEEAERKLIVAHSAPPVLFSGSNQGSGFSSNADERAVAIKDLYRRHINPAREVILQGLQSVFDLIDPEIILDFKDFEEETQLDTNKE